jgi:hypothetical protein
VSCEKNSEIKVYRVSKAPLEESAPQQQDAMPTNTAAPRMPGGLAPTGATEITTPQNWEPQPLSQMRQASFLVKGDNGAVADISFVSLGAAAGNVLDNVNREEDTPTIFVADAHRGDGQRFIVRADEKLTAFLELESAIGARGELL